MGRSDWSYKEAMSAIREYFRLLDQQNSGTRINKRESYRKLSAKHPGRPWKAFERKFQNISAVLHEEKRPYLEGLKPLNRYQKLLRILVWEFLSSEHQSGHSPIELLSNKLSRLKSRGFVPVWGTGSGRFGHTLERQLLIPQNSSKAADFLGIELKTKENGTLQTLFSRKPTNYTTCSNRLGLLKKHGYKHRKKPKALALYTSFSSTPCSLGFRLKITPECVRVMHGRSIVIEFDLETLEQALLSKHRESVYISVEKRGAGATEECRFDQAIYCRTPSFSRFLKLLEEGAIFLDFTLSYSEGKVKDHGFLWKISKDRIRDLYFESKRIL